MRRAVAASFALGALMALPAAAHAQRDAGVVVAQPVDEVARGLFVQGLTLLQQQHFAEAVPWLERSVARRENPAALAALAAAYRGAGRYRRAISTLERLLAVNTDAEREREVRGVLDDCQRALAHVTLRVTGSATDVRVDGEPIATADGVLQLALDPGAHTFEATRAEHDPSREERIFEAGALAAVALDASAHPRPATLVVETTDAAATIRVDAQPLGVGGGEFRIAPGRHAVQVRWPDAHDERRAVDLAPGARVTVSFAHPRPTAITSRWWFWTGAGVVTAALIVGGVIVFSGTEAPLEGSWGHASSALTAR